MPYKCHVYIRAVIAIVLQNIEVLCIGHRSCEMNMHVSDRIVAGCLLLRRLILTHFTHTACCVYHQIESATGAGNASIASKGSCCTFGCSGYCRLTG